MHCVWWGGVLWTVVFIAGWIICGWVPPQSPTTSAARLVSFYQHRQLRIEIGCTLFMFSLALVLVFLSAFAAQLRRIGGWANTLATAQLACWAINCILIFIPTCLWLTMAYRPSSNASLPLSDLSWIIWEMAVGPPMVWCGLVAVAILSDKREAPIFPRWLGYLACLCALGLTPAGFVVFFGHGAWAWNGLWGFWVPTIAWFVFWVPFVAMVLRAVKNMPETTGAEAPVTPAQAQTRASEAPPVLA